LAAALLYDEAGVNVLSCSRRREATGMGGTNNQLIGPIQQANLYGVMLRSPM